MVLWEGEPAKLPKAMARFKDAVAAAVKKASCSECMHMHYGKERLGLGRLLPSKAGAKTALGEKIAAALVKAPEKKLSHNTLSGKVLGDLTAPVTKPAAKPPAAKK